MPSVNTGTTSIPFGTSLRIGYRAYGSSSAFTYFNYYPDYNELPYTYSLDAGTWEVEYTVICPNCGGNRYSAPETTVVTVS